MGTDIHLSVEAQPIAGGAWVEVPKYETYVAPSDGGAPYFNVGIPDAEHPRVLAVRTDWYGDRNYDEFAMLADVRNGYGFAGIDRGEGFEPISDPRGLPGDMSDTVRTRLGDETDWMHSHSWFTLRELLDLEAIGYWDQTTVHRGWVQQEEYDRIGGSGQPSAWAGDVNPKHGYVHHEWIRTYRDDATALLGLIDDLAEWASNYMLNRFWLEDYDGPVERAYPVVLPAVADREPLPHWVDVAPHVRVVFSFDN